MTEPHTLYVFGTGNATMTRYYNTCFAIRSGEEYFMTDAGGGNGILRILEEMQVPLNCTAGSSAYSPCLSGITSI